MTFSGLNKAIKDKSSELGFDFCGIARVRTMDDHRGKIAGWLHKGYNAEMGYMERNLDKRTYPALLVDNARSVIITGMNYYNRYEPSDNQPVFARYALGHDYHRVVRDRLYELLDFIKECCPGTNGRAFSDSAPVLERAWAVEAGLGWIGRNSMLINKKTGSFFFLGALVIDAESGYDMPFEKDYCGNCRRCIEACPTGAINEDKTIDSNKCISYLTIEHKGDMGEIYHGKTQGRVFGCDICQEVCPWNRKAPVTKIDEFAPLPEILNFSIQQWREITEEEFNEIFKNSPLLRTGYHNFKRNLLLSFGE